MRSGRRIAELLLKGKAGTLVEPTSPRENASVGLEEEVYCRRRGLGRRRKCFPFLPMGIPSGASEGAGVVPTPKRAVGEKIRHFLIWRPRRVFTISLFCL